MAERAESIETRVIAAIVKSQDVDPAKVTPGTTFEELGMNSLDALALINELEEDFAVEIPNEEAMGLSSVGQAVECIRRLAAP
ncbi:MAG: acyl carrier protein [Acidobacteriota bacterium]|jgi:acyl carrier protein|nr:acyl carrier protein [Acidobacteriota bacterium]